MSTAIQVPVFLCWLTTARERDQAHEELSALDSHPAGE